MIRRMEIATDLPSVAELIYDTDKYLFPFLFGAREKALPILQALVRLDGNSFSHRHIWCDVEADQVRGILIGYDHRTIDERAETADFRAVLPLWDQFTLFFKYLILKPFMDKSDVTGLYIQNVCVAAEARGRGIGTGLIRHFCGLHPRDCFLDVELGNRQALALYERLGFQIMAEKTVFLPGLGSYRMVRRHAT
ncbi:MAG: GNAT family N-acetyltransferase [Spirochaetes bacterium]|nr:GNAT family N-acetyltransferase [Spirochaetota bacterium]